MVLTGDLVRKKNKEKRKGLEKDLKKKGIGYKKGVGQYKYDDGKTVTEVYYPQRRYLIKCPSDALENLLAYEGRKHGQESVITKDKELMMYSKLHYTDKSGKKFS